MIKIYLKEYIKAYTWLLIHYAIDISTIGKMMRI